MLKDAPLMLEWMHDESVIKFMQTDFKAKTEEDSVKFITDSWEESYLKAEQFGLEELMT